MRRNKALNIIRGRCPTEAAAIIPHLRPAWALTAQPANLSALPHGAHRFGGAPGLPRNFPWPHDGQRSYSFALQIDLEALDDHAAIPIDRTGWLLLFVDTKSSPVECRLLWFDARRGTLSTRNDDGRLRSAKWPVFALTLAPIWTLPAPSALPLIDDLANVDPVVWADLGERLRGGAPSSPRHQLMGHPDRGLAAAPDHIAIQLDLMPDGEPWPGADGGVLCVSFDSVERVLAG